MFGSDFVWAYDIVVADQATSVLKYLFDNH